MKSTRHMVFISLLRYFPIHLKYVRETEKGKETPTGVSIKSRIQANIQFAKDWSLLYTFSNGKTKQIGCVFGSVLPPRSFRLHPVAFSF